jgi:hypothetical protein
LFFDTGQAVLNQEGRGELDKLAPALLDLEKKIPSDISWVGQSALPASHSMIGSSIPIAALRLPAFSSWPFLGELPTHTDSEPMPVAYLEKLNAEQRRAVEHGVCENASRPTVGLGACGLELVPAPSEQPSFTDPKVRDRHP